MENNSVIIALVGAVSALVGVVGTNIVNFKKEDNNSKLNKRNDFTAIVEQMKYMVEKGEAERAKQEVELNRMQEQLTKARKDNYELKELFTELKQIIDDISIDPQKIEKIHEIYDKIKDK